MSNEKFTFFWHGPFSQWHIQPFVNDISGMMFNCAEQYMMHGKAMLFEDRETAEKIMGTQVPKQQKALGRVVKPFDPAKWEEHAREIVYRGNYLKFSTNDDLRELLYATEGTTLVEASPYDRIWGIGLSADDPRAQKRETWRGTNWLGQCLTELRDNMMKTSVI